jgi:type IV pilus assembly protein PilB
MEGEYKFKSDEDFESDDSTSPKKQVVILKEDDEKERRLLAKLSRELEENEKIYAPPRKEIYADFQDLVMDIHQHPAENVEFMTGYEKYGLLPLMIKDNKGDKKVIFALKGTDEKSKKSKNFMSFSIALKDEINPYEKLPKGATKEFILLSGSDFEEVKSYIGKEAEEARKRLLDIVNVEADISTRETYRDLVRVALKYKASDIHIEPVDNERNDIRLRIDGGLRRLENIVGGNKFKGLTYQKRKELVQIIKGNSKMNIAESRRPQDGSIAFNDGGHLYNLRVSTIPTNHGEKVVLRILEGMASAFNLEELNYPKKIAKDIRDLIQTPDGLILVTGPTGSGKTTTLYAILQELSDEQTNIMTVEDPIEIDLPGINQTQVNPTIGYDFPNALRAFLRQDPDIILVGEIRDEDTAYVTMQAAKTGHEVFSTLHSIDSIEALLRMQDFGRDPRGMIRQNYLRDIASCVRGILSQRLVRQLCDKCKVRNNLPDITERLAEIFGEDITKEIPGISEEMFSSFKATGKIKDKTCSYCEGVGYKGRIVIPELWIIGDEEREMISSGNTNHEDYMRVALNKGMWSLNYSSLRSIIFAGQTTFEEIFRTAIDKHQFIEKKDYIKSVIKRRVDRLKGQKLADTQAP